MLEKHHNDRGFEQEAVSAKPPSAAPTPGLRLHPGIATDEDALLRQRPLLPMYITPADSLASTPIVQPQGMP